jgi:putative membrane protein
VTFEHRSRHPPLEDARGLQANERTLLAWVRTGVSLITFGFAIARLSEWLKPPGRGAPRAAIALGGVFMFLGVVAEAVGVIRYLVVRRALLAHRPVPTGGTEVLVLAVVVGVVGLMVGLYVVL